MYTHRHRRTHTHPGQVGSRAVCFLAAVFLRVPAAVLLELSAESGLCYEAGEQSKGPLHSFLPVSPLIKIRRSVDHTRVTDVLKHLSLVLGLFGPQIKHQTGGVIGFLMMRREPKSSDVS